MTMKRKIIFRLSLVAVFLVSYSCRNDMLPEKEIFENSSQFQLTSRRMSLAESKHKLQLLPEISEAQTLLRSVKSNVAGKIIDYGNGTSIDTNDVIYIENGPNYHTYTFNIIRENAPANAPLENLVLSPLSDGTYREILVSYYITDQEKEILRSGGTVDTKNKVTYQSLETGSFQSGITSKTQDCHLEINFYYTECSENMHHHGEQYPECTANQPSELVYVITEVCTDTSGGSDNPWNPNFPDLPGGGGGGEEGGSSTPCNGNGVLTGPQTPASGIGYDSGDGCTGVPTSPNIPNLSNPCEKTKPFITTANAILHNPAVQQKMDAILKGKVSAPNEWAVAIGQKPDGTYEVTSAVEQNATNGSIPSSQLASLYIADGHSHAGNSGNPSGGDLYYLIKGLKTNYPDVKYRYVYGNDGFGNPEVYAFIVNDKNLAFNFLTQFPESENYDTQTHAIKETSELGEEFYKATKHFSEGRSENSASGENYDSRAIGMAYILDKYNAGISISKVDASGNLKKINVTVEQIVVPYSGGATKEGVKVSKCP